MAKDGDGVPTKSLELSVGKQVDAALGDVIRGLLKKPSEAVGDIIADGIGILGDRVKRKRELNATLGMEEVRKRLEDAGVDVKDIISPKEEELHLLMNGMSLAGDKCVRDMWAGLFAKALEPGSEVSAERPFISILQTLSPLDAKIIDFISFILKKDAEAKSKSKNFFPKDFKNITMEDKAMIEDIIKENASIQDRAFSDILEKAEDYGFSDVLAPGWADNLLRQGVIERVSAHEFAKPSVFSRNINDQRDLIQLVDVIYRNMQVMQDLSQRVSSPPQRIFERHTRGAQIALEVQFTTFGRRFAEACDLI